MEATTGCRDDLRVVLASRAGTPLEHGEAVLAVHKVAAGVIEWDLSIEPGLSEARQREHKRRPFAKGSYPVRSAMRIGACFPVWTALSSCVLVLADGGACCFPAWAVLAYCF